MISPDVAAKQALVPPRSGSGKQDVLLAWILFAATLAVYFPVHRYPFVDIDDGLYVSANPHVLAPLNWSNLKWAFTNVYVLNNDPLQKVLAKTKDNEKITQVLANMGHAYSELGDDARAGECWDAALHVRPLPAKPQVSSWWRNPFGFIRERLRALRSEDDLPAQRQ